MPDTDREPSDIVEAFLMGKATRELTEKETMEAVEAMASEIGLCTVAINEKLLGQIEVSAAIAGKQDIQAHMEYLLTSALAEQGHQGLDIERIECARRGGSALIELTKAERDVFEQWHYKGTDIPR